MSGRHARSTLVCSALFLTFLVSEAAADLRVVSYNTQTLGDPTEAPGTPDRDQWDALVAVLRRVDADVVMLQEVAGASEVSLLPDLASAAAYSDFAVSDISGTLSGGLRIACLSRFPLVPELTDSWSAAELSQSFGGAAMPEANDIGRDIFHVGVDAGEAEPHILFTLHLKSGSGGTNSFRRQVEITRLLQAVELIRVVSPLSPLILTGDFNEDPRDAPFTSSWTAPPGGLPASYQLGSDIVFPVLYSPFESLEEAGFRLLVASQEDAPEIVLTRPASARRLDLIWCNWAVNDCATLVYESCLDDGIDAPPWGTWIPLDGSPLACGQTELAADHLPVVADLRTWDDEAAPLGLTDVLRVHSHGDPSATNISAWVDWSGDDLAARPGLEHYHVSRGTLPDSLSLVRPHDSRDRDWFDETPRSMAPLTVHYYRVVVADACEAESR